MSDEQRAQGRDGNTAAGAPRTEQHPVPPYAGPAQGPATQQFPFAGGPQPGYGAAYPAPPQREPRRRGTGRVVALALAAGLIGGGAGGVGAWALVDGGSPVRPQIVSAPASTNVAAAEPGTVAGAAAITLPSTVDLRVATGQGVAEGSGVIITASGDVLTNNHVVAGASGPIEVTAADGTQYEATVVGTAPSYDLAVIRLRNADGLAPITFASSEDVQIGQQVVAVGSPQGLSGTVTTGIVSAFGRTVRVQGEDGSAVVYSGLQTDAPINPGNSGGPLVDLQGRLVGINSAIATGGGQSNGNVGIGFVIPIDTAERVARELLDTGTATKPVLGVTGSAGAGASTAGAQIAQVQPGSPAAAAGLQPGDVVTKVGEARVEDFADLIARIGAQTPGGRVALTARNGAGERTVDVTLSSQPDQGANTSSGGQSTDPFGGRNPFGEGGPFGGGN